MFKHETPRKSEPLPSEGDAPDHYVDKGQFDAEMDNLVKVLPTKDLRRKISVPGQLIGKLDTAKKKNDKLEKRQTRHLSDEEGISSNSSSFDV